MNGKKNRRFSIRRKVTNQTKKRPRKAINMTRIDPLNEQINRIGIKVKIIFFRTKEWNSMVTVGIGVSNDGNHDHRTTTETWFILGNDDKIGDEAEVKEGGIPMIGIITNTTAITTTIQTHDTATQTMDGIRTTTDGFRTKAIREDLSVRQPAGTAIKTMEQTAVTKTK